LIRVLELDLIFFRFTDYIFEVISSQFIGINGLFDTKVKEIGNNKWKIYDKNNFWSIYQYDEYSDMLFSTDNSIKNFGLNEIKRYIDCLEENNEGFMSNIISEFTKSALYKSKNMLTPVFGHIDVNFPLFQPHATMFLENMLTNPDIIDKFMKITQKGLIKLLEDQLKLNISGVIATNDFCFKTGPIISPELFKKFIFPYYAEFVNMCHRYNKLFIKHLDGNASSILEMLVRDIKLDGIQAIEPQAGMDIKKIKEKYGKEITLIGNLDCAGVLQFGTEEEIIKSTEYLIKNLKKDGGYIFGSSNSIHKGIPTKNFLMALNYLKNHGEY